MKNVKIYTLKHPDTKEIKYIGKTELSLEKRLYYHIYDLNKCKNIHKKSWFNKLLKINKKPTIELLDEVPLNEWRFWEKFYISLFKTWGFKLINCTDGGEGYDSVWLKKLWKDPTYRDYHTKRVQGKKNPFYGRNHSEKTKKILRKKCPKKGKANGMFGKKRKKEEVEKMIFNQPTIKTIIRMDMENNVIDEWVGIKRMSRELNLDDSAVIRVMKGKSKHHKNYKFKYK